MQVIAIRVALVGDGPLHDTFIGRIFRRHLERQRIARLQRAFSETFKMEILTGRAQFIAGGQGTAAEKMDALARAGVHVVKSHAVMGANMREALGR